MKLYRIPASVLFEIGPAIFTCTCTCTCRRDEPLTTMESLQHYGLSFDACADHLLGRHGLHNASKTCPTTEKTWRDVNFQTLQVPLWSLLWLRRALSGFFGTQKPQNFSRICKCWCFLLYFGAIDGTLGPILAPLLVILGPIFGHEGIRGLEQHAFAARAESINAWGTRRRLRRIT